MPQLSIIIPARNEESNIISAVMKLEETVKVDFEIIIVNDHSMDNTKNTADDLAAKYANIRVVENQSAPSFVNAFVCGISHVRSEIFVPVMADLCDDPETINKMYEKINEGYDIVAGSRYMCAGKRLGGPVLKAFFSSFMGKSLFFLIGIPTHDIANAFKMYRKKILNGMLIESRGFEVSVEIPLKAYFNGAKITEVATVWKERETGKSNFKMFKIGPRYMRLYLWAIIKSLSHK